MNSIAVEWNGQKKDYKLDNDAKKQLKNLPGNIATSIKQQLRDATEFTRKGLMEPAERIEF